MMFVTKSYFGQCILQSSMQKQAIIIPSTFLKGRGFKSRRSVLDGHLDILSH